MGEICLVTKDQMEQLKNDPNWLPAPGLPPVLKGDSPFEYEIPPGFYTNPDVKVSQALRRDSPMDAVRRAKGVLKLRLKKDIVIPAGTIFSQAPIETLRSSDHVEHVFGLTKDTAGSVIYEVQKGDPQFADWFEEVP